jgi:hypothetical protein
MKRQAATSWPSTESSALFVRPWKILMFNPLLANDNYSPHNTGKWQMGFNSVFKGLMGSIPLRV